MLEIIIHPVAEIAIRQMAEWNNYFFCNITFRYLFCKQNLFFRSQVELCANIFMEFNLPGTHCAETPGL